MKIPVLSLNEVMNHLVQKSYPAQKNYLLMYSSWLGGIVEDPRLMFVPIDDHMVHRGDGVFEAMKSYSGQIYLSQPHLNRLEQSAERIGIKLPFAKEEIQKIVQECVDHARAKGVEDVLIRLYVSRGPGGFTTNPYECVGSQLYIVINRFVSPAAEKFENGVKIARSHVPIKEGWFSQVKSCNYLPNVLMKKESVDMGVDFTINVTEDGYIGESSTENIAIVDRDGILRHPPFDYILKGTTMIRAFELAQKSGMKTSVGAISYQELLSAQEVMMIGTTLDVLPVTEVDGQKISGGGVGPIARKLLSLVRADQ